MDAGRKLNYDRAAEYLDFRYLPVGMTEIQKPNLARQLKIVLDRAPWIDLGELSTDPKGYEGDGLHSYRDLAGRIEVGGQTINILLQHVPREDGILIWKFSNATVAQIPRLYQEYGYRYLGKIFPEAFFDLKILGMEVWLWVGLLIIGIIAFGVAYAVTAIIHFVVRLSQTAFSNQLSGLVKGPGPFFLSVLVANVLVDHINPPISFRAVLQAQTLVTIALVWLAMGIVDFMLARLTERYERYGKSSARVNLSPLGMALKTVLIIIALAVWLENLGFEVTTLLAGLGIGGLAVALALQKPIENLISAITLYASQPVAVGDFYRFGDKIGTVEEIGLQATIVRTLDNTIITIPNVEFAHTQLENFSKRKKFGIIHKSDCGMTPLPIRYVTFLSKSESSCMHISKSFPTRPGCVSRRLAPFLLTLKSLRMSTSRIMENFSRWLRI